MSFDGSCWRLQTVRHDELPQQRHERMSINVHNVLVLHAVARLMFVDEPLDQVRVTSELFGRDPSWALGSRGQPYSAELFTEIGGGLGKYFIDETGLSLRVRFPNDGGPDGRLVEVTTKPQVFVPAQGLGYIRVKGLTFEHAGNNFPFPQTGMVSTSGGHISSSKATRSSGPIRLLSVGWWRGRHDAHVIRGNTMRYCGLSG
jgi:hypothetical protein